MNFKSCLLIASFSAFALGGCSGEPNEPAAGSDPTSASKQGGKGSVDNAPVPQENSVGATPPARPTVPERFRGLFAMDRQACAEDYNYAPAFQNVRIEAQSVSFFETGGPVTNVQVDGEMAAITLRETVGDGEFTRAIYLAINPDGSVRYRQGKDQPSQNYVRCEGK